MFEDSFSYDLDDQSHTHLMDYDTTFPENWNREYLNYDNSDRCSICLDIFKANDYVITHNNIHSFHYECVKPWYKKHKNCPLDRKKFGKSKKRKSKPKKRKSKSKKSKKSKKRK
jgi:hypothetical protein